MKKFSISVLVIGIALFVLFSNPLTSSVITKGDIQTAEIKVGA
ncbi:MAG: hypothetical protein ACQEWR_18220 [Bacillota bacterium]